MPTELIVAGIVTIGLLLLLGAFLVAFVCGLIDGAARSHENDIFHGPFRWLYNIARNGVIESDKIAAQRAQEDAAH